MLSGKENYLRMGKGLEPEYVPIWTMGMQLQGEQEDSTPAVMCMPSAPELNGGMPPMSMDGGEPAVKEFTNMWGVPFIANEETGWAFLPRTWDFHMDDITKWDQLVKAPDFDIDTIDWEAMAKKDLEPINRDKFGVLCMGGFDPFQGLVAQLGFTNALVALLEEPESVKEMLNYMTDWYEPIVEHVLDYYKPDLFYMLDDSANARSPFFSMDVYRDIFKPIYTRMARHAVDRGVPIQFHNCGYCTPQLDDMIDFGVNYWDPAQTANDLVALAEKYRSKNLVIAGGFDFIPEDGANVQEEEVRAYVRQQIDLYAPTMRYAFCGGYLGQAGWAENTMQVNMWIMDEVYHYGHAFYKS